MVVEANFSYDFFIRICMLTQEKYNWHTLEDSSYNYVRKNQEWYSISDDAFYLWNGLASVVDPKSGRRQQISI